MDSRERTFLAIEHKMGDRIPIDFWASASMIRKLERSLGIPYDQFLDRHDVDLRYIAGPEYVGPPLGPDKDIWGVERTTVDVQLGDGTESYREVVESPLASATCVEDIECYPAWPSPEWFTYDVIEAQCDAIRAQGRVVVFMGDRLNRVAQLKPAMYLRGLENIYVDLAMRPQIAQAIIDRIRSFYLAYLERILHAAKGKVDIILTGDDFGSQNGMLISPGMWRTFIKPGFIEFIGLIRHYRAKTMHHTCGSVVEIIPDMIECGLDVLQSLQPEAANMSLSSLKSRFGDRLCFHGGVSIQRTMPFGTPDEIRKKVLQIADLVKPGGGYIWCTAHNIQADTSVENVQALLQAYKEYGSA